MLRVSLLCALLVVSVSAADRDLVGRWILDAQHVTDATLRADLGGLDGRILGVARPAGRGESAALSFDGRETSVLLSDSPAGLGLPTKALTVEAWVAVARAADWGTFLGFIQDNGGAESGWLLGYTGDRFCFALSSKGADDGDGRLTYLKADAPFELARWYHVAGVYDGTRMRLYVNGRLAGTSDEQSGELLYPDHGFYEIGAYHDDDERYWLRGRMQSVTLWSRPLSGEEVAAHYAEHVGLAALPPFTSGLIVGPYLQHVTQTSIVIMWETARKATSLVEYGRQVPLAGRAESSRLRTIHETRIEGLQPGTSYLYSVSSTAADGTQAESDVYTFKTAPVPGTPIAFVVVGDSRTYPRNWSRIAKAAWAERPDIALHVGDVVSNGNVKEQWATEWIAPAAELMRRVPMYVAIGNHEGNSHWYYDYVSYPAPENYYSFDYGDAHFAIVDSNRDLSPGSPQYEWLDRDLGASRARWKFVAHHHPQYSSDSNDYGDTATEQSILGDRNARKIIPLLEKHGVDIVWVGHIHDYERTWPLRAGKVDPERGVIYIQTGGGGAELEEFAPTRSWFTAKVKADWEFCLVTISGDELRVMAYDIDGRLFDYLELRK